MNTTLAIVIALSGVSLVFSLLIYRQHRRAGTPVPRYEVGATMGTIGVPLVLAGTSKIFGNGVSLALVCCGLLLGISGALLVARALRQRRPGGR